MTYKISVQEGKKVYFASDFHLGAPDFERSLVREKKIVAWLNEVSRDADTIFILGDIFDFWYEYKYVVPKGFVRILGKIAELSDSGIRIIIFTGNHDMWSFGYLEKELGAEVYRKPSKFQINEKSFLIGHGDGLGPGDGFYKILKAIFESKTCRWIFSRFHPNFAVGLAFAWSSRSRAGELKKEDTFFGEKEWLIQYCKEIESKEHHDYYIFGHRHYPVDFDISNVAKYINLGEWMNFCSYAKLEDGKLSLKTFTQT